MTPADDRMLNPASAIENDFCEGCGICCDGTLFRHGSVTETEKCRLETLGLSLFEDGGQVRFRIPCDKLEDGRCSVYSQRPQTCRDFRCTLLKRHQRGELAPGEGKARVAQAKEMVKAVAAHDPAAVRDGERQGLWLSLSRQLVGASKAEKEQIAGRLLAIAALETYLRQWFRKDESA